MILGIDASQANRKIRSGTEWYAFHLIEGFKRELAGRADVKVRLYLRDAPQADLAKDLPANFEFKILNWPFKYFWGQIRLSWEMLRHATDLLFCPAHTIPLVHPRKTLTTLHDIGFEDNPELYDKLSLWYHKWSAEFAVRHAAHIFTISEFSKRRIVDVYKCQPGKISVTYLGVDSGFGRDGSQAVLKKYGLAEKKYILFVGRLEPKKNILGMVKAFEQYLSLRATAKQSQGQEIASSPPGKLESPRNDSSAPNFVFAGRKVRIDEVDEYLVDKPNLRNKIKFLGYTDQQDMRALYTGALVFLFPTFYEGFGLPILEAQSTGTPVITSNITSNPEIAGQGAVIVDPYNIAEIAKAINRLISDENFRNEIVKKGFENVKKFSWEETVKQTLNSILSSRTGFPLSRE